ncbi:AadA family aminoglycoside 3''-O-nucleotidyltransferase [Pseudomonas sp.]|uniref:AadA family aminoglycoside 3''-O-nucleotidyltransferase n=1 Tax=Pseudomonas sp. TaxID=306 RepID=UPI003D139462
MNPPMPSDIAEQLASACTVLKQHLGGTLQAIHLFGSAVDGGLRPHSDIDLLVTVGRPLPGAVRRALMLDLLSVSAWPGTDPSRRALEVTVLVHDQLVPWRYPPQRELQFGEWLREELLAGRIPPATPDPDIAILLTQARQHSLCLAGPPMPELFEPVPREDLARALAATVAQWNEAPDWQGDERNVVLALARIWFSAATGAIAPKDVAASWILERLPPEQRPVLAHARTAYLQGVDHTLSGRTEQVAAFVRYARNVIEHRLPGTR